VARPWYALADESGLIKRISSLFNNLNDLYKIAFIASHMPLRLTFFGYGAHQIN
jgi:hypothetical protein